MSSANALYLGFDLSTQQLKCLAVNSDLRVEYEAKFDFDSDSRGFPNIRKGVLTNEAEGEVFAPVALWLQAVDAVLSRLSKGGLDFSRVAAISGAGQQHGSVYWSKEGEKALEELRDDGEGGIGTEELQVKLKEAFAHPFSPNWQDASTQRECDEFDRVLGDEKRLAEETGSKAHHRFTGPQILRFRRKHPEAWARTSRVSLVSSFLASLFLGQVAPLDRADVCGMNLWDIPREQYHPDLMRLAASDGSRPSEVGLEDLTTKLGEPVLDGGATLGHIAAYFVQRYGFTPTCRVTAFTGDNPATILSLPLRSNDAIVSLGTSTTFLMSTPRFVADPSVHFFLHPTTKGLYMYMNCFKNGSAAREEIRDALSSVNNVKTQSWAKFDKALMDTFPLCRRSQKDPMRLGLFFPRHEIVPNLRAGKWHYDYDPFSGSLKDLSLDSFDPASDARTVVESQLLSPRLRSREIVERPEGTDLPPQPRRIYLVGGGSRSLAIARVAGQVLGGAEGVYKLDVGENACALGAAYKAVWAAERDWTEAGAGGHQKRKSFEELIGERWREGDFAERIAPGYDRDLFLEYGIAVEGFNKMEKFVLENEGVRGRRLNGEA